MAGSRRVDLRRGSIYRVTLENFVTYRQVELFPGPNLNLIIGPNGTGKSTFICAIVLGLCGKTSVLGRAKKIGEYVRSGCEEATIEIELHCGNNNKNVVITRNFNVENTSVWSIDKKAAKEKQVQELVASLNICVDNLCQLLPQDRVQDFARMNPQQLLKSTELAISGQGAVSFLEQLIELKNKSKSSDSTLDSNRQQLLEEERLNSRLENVIKSIEESKVLKGEIDICTKKLIWAEYEQLKKEVDVLAKDKKKALKLLKTIEEKLEPYKKNLITLESQNQHLEMKRKLSISNISKWKSEINSQFEMSENEDEKIKELQSDWESKINFEKNRQTDIECAKMTLVKFESDKDNLIANFGSETHIKSKIAEFLQPILSIKSEIQNCESSKLDFQHEIESQLSPQIRLCQSKLNKLNDATNKRMEFIKNFNEDTYKALLWFRENKHLFKHPVYEPMILELNFKEPQLTKYFENTVAIRDLIAFTFEDSEDMNLFLKRVRSEFNWKTTNAVCSRPSNKIYTPPIPIEHLRKYGFHTYLIDIVSGPKAILNFLCEHYGLYRIPIGDDKTYNMSQNVPPEIKFFFSANHRFVIKISIYSGEKLTSTSEIRPARILANTSDQDAVNNTQKQLDSFINQREKKFSKITQIDNEISKLDSKLNSFIAKRHELNEALDKVKTIMSRVRMQQNKVHAMENQPKFDVELEKSRFKKEVAKCACNVFDIQNNVHNHYQKLNEETIKMTIINIKLKVIFQSILDKKRELADMQTNSSNLENNLSTINSTLTRTTAKAKEKLAEARHATGKLLPHEEGFPFSEEFSKLPCDLSEIQDHLIMLQARADRMDNADDGTVEEYNNRKNLINSLQEEIRKLTSLKEQEMKKMEQLKNEWLPSLEEKIIKINEKFDNMFAQLGCAGEVKLSKAGGEDDYDQYGISVLVKFREEETLQQLTHYTQSGGERALATALYLMALQQLSQAPFRCVDEVNQGMDPINERKMFQLLVKVTTESDASSQYFLLTPKLLYKLDYPENIKVLTIMNGPCAVTYSKWNFKKFINRANKKKKL